MELRSGQIIHRSSVSWLRPRKWQDNPNHILVYNSLRYYMSKWRMNCAELLLQYDKRN